MKSGTQLLNVRSSRAKLKIAIFQENDAVSRNTIHHLRHFVSRPETDSTGNGPKLFWSRLLPTIPTLLFPGPRSWLQDWCSSVSSQRNRDERASWSWGTNARTEAILCLYKIQRRPREKGGRMNNKEGEKKKKGDKKEYREKGHGTKNHTRQRTTPRTSEQKSKKTRENRKTQ